MRVIGITGFVIFEGPLDVVTEAADWMKMSNPASNFRSILPEVFPGDTVRWGMFFCKGEQALIDGKRPTFDSAARLITINGGNERQPVPYRTLLMTPEQVPNYAFIDCSRR
ncbi:MAG: hypothetical protein PHY92_05570 [Alphaproteobacteria bacterium]|nr:hypothetical protein [Alphaproteobacteria bacterium]